MNAVGAPLYGKDPDPTGLSKDDWDRAVAEHDAFEWLQGAPAGSAGANDARIFLASGGFPHTAPQPGSAEYRIAVEDLKSRFAGCAWRDPVDPDKVLGGISATAAAEWQQEIASQQVQPNQVLDANATATKALATGAKALGELLGQSWIADHLARWQDYWSPGGAGWIGDAPGVIEVHAAKGKCLDVQSAAKTDGTPVQVYTCNGSAAQAWRVYGDDVGLHLQNVNSNKCLDVNGNAAVNGTQIQIWGCHENPAQTWEYNLHATTSLKNVGTGKCLDCTRSPTASTRSCTRATTPLRSSSTSSRPATPVRFRRRHSSTRPRRASPTPRRPRRSSSPPSRCRPQRRRRPPRPRTRPRPPRTPSRTRTARHGAVACWSESRRRRSPRGHLPLLRRW
ncbi:RICIN domain-containing protein [Streptomyces sp. NBC_01020]|uniref:RICIN domain-containing protein n=1 Tax=Streptomyces sp. NBC_01020 TaxID=2903722 RepID=UPI00386BEF4E